MKLKCVLLWISIFLIGTGSSGQSKKDIRTYNIHSTTETTIEYKNGEERLRYTSEVLRFNSKGDWIEKTTYKKDGSLKKSVKREYDKRVLMEESLEVPGESAKDAKPATEPSYERITYEYHRDRLMEERVLDREGKVLKTKHYTYNRFGDKITEIEKNKKGEIVETERFEYDRKGLRTVKYTYNDKVELIEENRYAYE